MKRAKIPQKKGKTEKAKKNFSIAELNFLKEFARTGNYTKASEFAYPTQKKENHHNNGYIVAKRPHIKAEIDLIRKRILEEVDDPSLYRKMLDIHEKTAFQKIILKKKKISDGEVSVEEQEVDQTPLALQAVKAIMNFKRSAEQSLTANGPINVSVVMDNRILNVHEKDILENPKQKPPDDSQVIIDI